MKNILIVDDDLNIAELIKDLLIIDNYKADYVLSGKQALETLKKQKYDLIVLDVMLPDLNGFEIIEKIRKYEIPVLFLSAKTDDESVVKGLKLGAEDYIRKPFNRLELLARIETILKRNTKTKEVYSFKDIKLDKNKRIVSKSDKIIDLRPKEYELLELFLKNINIALSKEEILNKVWGIDADIETRTVDYHIQQLRKKLELKNEIVTIHKIGYRLED